MGLEPVPANGRARAWLRLLIKAGNEKVECGRWPVREEKGRGKEVPQWNEISDPSRGFLHFSWSLQSSQLQID
jgi:hypothetical protein